MQTISGTAVWNDLSLGLVDVIASPDAASRVEQQLGSISHSTLIENVQALIDAENAHSELHSDLVDADAEPLTAAQLFADFQDAATYQTYLESLPGATPVTIGKSFLGVDIKGITFGTGPNHIVAHGAVHAREWYAISNVRITPATTVYVADQLLGNTPEAVQLRSNFTFTFIPVLNVDGYAFTRDKSKGDRLWRKNRQVTSGQRCIGIDPNRNFPTGWSKAGASGSACSDTYYGPAALAAPESAAIYNYVKGLGNVVSYMDFHSYSQLWMFPYGYDCNVFAKDKSTLLAGSKAAVDAIYKSSGLSFKNGPICTTIYQASGSSVDSMYDIGVKYSYTAELRDKGRYGFVLPADQIVDSGKEITTAMFALYKYIANNL